MGVPEGKEREKGAESLFKEIIAKSFWNLVGGGEEVHQDSGKMKNSK